MFRVSEGVHRLNSLATKHGGPRALVSQCNFFVTADNIDDTLATFRTNLLAEVASGVSEDTSYTVTIVTDATKQLLTTADYVICREGAAAVTLPDVSTADTRVILTVHVDAGCPQVVVSPFDAAQTIHGETSWTIANLNTLTFISSLDGYWIVA